MSADKKSKFHNGKLEQAAQHAARTMTKAAREAIVVYLEFLRLEELEAMSKNSDPARLHQGQGVCKGLDAAAQIIKSEEGYDLVAERQSRRREGKI